MESQQEIHTGARTQILHSKQMSFSLRYPVLWEQQPLVAGPLGAPKPQALPVPRCTCALLSRAVFRDGVYLKTCCRCAHLILLPQFASEHMPMPRP